MTSAALLDHTFMLAYNISKHTRYDSHPPLHRALERVTYSTTMLVQQGTCWSREGCPPWCENWAYGTEIETIIPCANTPQFPSCPGFLPKEPNHCEGCHEGVGVILSWPTSRMCNLQPWSLLGLSLIKDKGDEGKQPGCHRLDITSLEQCTGLLPQKVLHWL